MTTTDEYENEILSAIGELRSCNAVQDEKIDGLIRNIDIYNSLMTRRCDEICKSNSDEHNEMWIIIRALQKENNRFLGGIIVAGSLLGGIGVYIFTYIFGHLLR